MADSHGPGDRIVSVTERLRNIRFPEQAKLTAYWRTLRGKRLLPARADVDPRAIEDCLEYAFILERIAPGLARFRLAGMHLNDLMGMEVRGMPVTCFFPPEARRQISAVVEEVCEGPATAVLELKGEDGFGKPEILGELTLLPMTNDFGDVNRIMGALTTVGRLGRTPRRFEVTSLRITPLLDGTTPFRDQGPRLPRVDEVVPHSRKERSAVSIDEDAPVAPGFSEAAPGFDYRSASSVPPRANSSKASRPHLYLVKTEE